MKETCLLLCVAINSTTTRISAANTLYTRWTFLSKRNIPAVLTSRLFFIFGMKKKLFTILIHEDFTLQSYLQFYTLSFILKKLIK